MSARFLLCNLNSDPNLPPNTRGRKFYCWTAFQQRKPIFILRLNLKSASYSLKVFCCLPSTCSDPRSKRCVSSYHSEVTSKNKTKPWEEKAKSSPSLILTPPLLAFPNQTASDVASICPSISVNFALGDWGPHLQVWRDCRKNGWGPGTLSMKDVMESRGTQDVWMVKVLPTTWHHCTDRIGKPTKSEVTPCCLTVFGTHPHRSGRPWVFLGCLWTGGIILLDCFQKWLAGGHVSPDYTACAAIAPLESSLLARPDFKRLLSASIAW